MLAGEKPPPLVPSKPNTLPIVPSKPPSADAPPISNCFDDFIVLFAFYKHGN